YSVKIILSGCESLVSTPVTVTERPVPVATITHTEATTFCDGGTVVLTSSLADSYQWYKGGVAIDGETNRTYTATASGDYSVKITLSGCESLVSTPVTVTERPVPVATITHTEATTFCDGGTVLLTASLADSYQWYKGGVAIDGETNRTYTATASGDYSVKIILSGCESLV
ncbi:hypothetical protein, partial [Pedobacter gandavensis]|uniref:Ig-like domain-containing protein n=1 Tax=Pedobacter gandavensis TaxID=2679963 RepID=UPI002930E5DE